jgi:hypothetical protein
VLLGSSTHSASEGYVARLRAVSAAGTRELEPPRDVDESGRIEVLGMALLSETEGWAFGRRGALWRLSAGRWERQPAVLEWTPGAPRGTAACAGIEVSAGGRGWLIDRLGASAWLSNGVWRRTPPGAPGATGDPIASLLAASGVGQGGSTLFRFEGEWRPLRGELGAGARPLLDRTGRRGRSRWPPRSPP